MLIKLKEKDLFLRFDKSSWIGFSNTKYYLYTNNKLVLLTEHPENKYSLFIYHPTSLYLTEKSIDKWIEGGII